MKCLPFLHEYKIIKWRLIHIPEFEPATIVLRLKCEKCKKEKNKFTYQRDESWEDKNRELERDWF